MQTHRLKPGRAEKNLRSCSHIASSIHAGQLNKHNIHTYINAHMRFISHMHTHMQTCTHVYCWQIMHLHATIHATILHACGQYTCMQTPRGRRAIVEEDSQATEALNRSPSKSPCGCFGTISFPAKAGNTFYNKSFVERGREKSTYIFSGKELYIYICDRTFARQTGI